MELHRIVAPDASKATAEALRLYGPNALVISTRRLKNDRTEIIVATEAAEGQATTELLATASASITADNAQAPAPAPEAKGGKAFKAAFEAQLGNPKARAGGSPTSTPSAGEAKAEYLRAAVDGVGPAPHPKDEGLVLLNAIHEELARLRSEVGALKAERQDFMQSQDRDRLMALGLPDDALSTVQERLASGALPPLPKLTEGANAQAHWLAQLLCPPEAIDPLKGMHILRAEDSRVQAEIAAALAMQGEQRFGCGSTLLVAIGQDDAQWRQVTKAALAEGVQVLRARNSSQLERLLSNQGLGSQLCLLLPASGEDADTLRRVSALQGVPRHQVLPSDRLTSPFLGTLVGGSETDTVMVHRFHKSVPLDHFVATMLKAGKGVSVLHEDGGDLSGGLTASLALMAAWAAKAPEQIQPEAGKANAWPLALHG
jgi:hypothetical protein